MTPTGEDIYPLMQKRLDTYISEHGLRRTQERNFVLGKVCALQCFSIEELQRTLTGMRISRATVYNALGLFGQAGIVHRLEKEFGVRAGQYEVLQPGRSHIRLVCERCGRVSDVKNIAVHRTLTAQKFTNFNLRQYSLYLYGMCKTCRRLLIANHKPTRQQ